MKLILALIFLLIAGFALLVRLAPVDPARWHSDPAKAAKGRAGGFALRPGGDAEPPVFAVPDLLARLDAIAMASPRTTRISGSVEDGRITYQTRSRLWGFPDYTTIATASDEDGTMPIIDARLRFGRSDLGVNRTRVEDWLAQLDAAIGIAD